MFCNTVSNIENVSTLWCFLESNRNTLYRIREGSSPSPLDFERLEAFRDFLKCLADPNFAIKFIAEKGIANIGDSELCYSLDVDLQNILEKIPSLSKWNQKDSFEDKMVKLANLITDFVDGKNNKALLLPELTVLDDISRILCEEVQARRYE